MVVGIVGRSHSGIGRKTRVACGAAAHPRVGVAAGPFHESGAQSGVVERQKAHAGIRVLGAA